MNDTHADEITILLNDENAAITDVKAKLEKSVYLDLKRIAANRLASESKNGTLTVTSLVHEAYTRLAVTHSMTWKNRKHYFGAAAEAMRRILIDRARYHLANRRVGQKMSIPLDDSMLLVDIKPRYLVELDEALTGLDLYDSDMANLVKLRYFAGLSIKEIADLLKLSPRTVDRRWEAARAWLLSELGHV